MASYDAAQEKVAERTWFCQWGAESLARLPRLARTRCSKNAGTPPGTVALIHTPLALMGHTTKKQNNGNKKKKNN